MKYIPFVFVVFFIFEYLSSVSCWAKEKENWPDALKMFGWTEAIQSMRIQSPSDSLASRVKLRLGFTVEMDWVYGFVSADVEKNWEISSETGIDLHEVWLEHVSDNWDLRIGKQIIIWGQADGIQVTDMISPLDYTESITRELDEIRIPVDAARLRWLGLWDSVDFELVWIPVFKAAVSPSGDNPWSLEEEYPDTIQLSTIPAAEPGISPAESEIAIKISAYVSGLDVAASVFYTWSDYPTMFRSVIDTDENILIQFMPRHKRLTIFGLEGAYPWADFTFRFEAAYYKGRYYEPASVYDQPLQKDSYKWLGGVDWSPGRDWSVTAQLSGSGIFNHDDRLIDPAHSTIVTLNISKELLHQTLTLSNMLYWSIDDGEFYNQIKAKYEMMDGLHFLVGADIFYGDNGSFGMYKDNSQIWIKAKYSFDCLK